jgi:hypothetical protein
MGVASNSMDVPYPNPYEACIERWLPMVKGMGRYPAAR